MNNILKNIKVNIFVFIILYSYSFPATFTITDDETKEPLTNANIIISQGANIYNLRTDSKGEVSQDLEVGKASVTLLDKNYNGLDKPVTISSNNQTYPLSFTPSKKNIKSLNEVKTSSLARPPIGGRKFDSKLLNETIQPVGFDDILSSMKKLPGVTFYPFLLSGAIFIQGGSGDDWSARFNGVYVHDPLVWNRLISMFNPIYTDNFILYTAAMPSMFPNALSGAIDLTSKEYKNSWSGTLSFNLTTVAAYTGGPINKKKNANMFMYVRRTLFEMIVPKSKGKNAEIPNTWDAGLTFNFIPTNRLHVQQNNWMVLSGINTIQDEAEVDRYKKIVGYNPKNRNFANKEYLGVHSIKFDYDMSSETSISTTAALIPNYAFLTNTDNGVEKTEQKFLLLENQYNLEGKIMVGEHILQPGITASYLYYQSHIDDYQTVANSVGNYEKVHLRENKKEHRGLFFPYFNADLALVGDTLRMDIGGMISYSTSNQDVFFSPSLRFNYKTAPFNRIYIGGGVYNKTDQKLFSKLKSQKAVHSVLGTQFIFPKVLFSLEGFYKYFWDLPVLQKDVLLSYGFDRSLAYDSVGTKHAAGFGTGLTLMESRRSVVSGDFSYTFQMAYRYDKKSKKSNFGNNLNYAANPPVEQWYKDHLIREHSFGVEVRIRPFVLIPVQNKYNSPSWYGAFNNYISTSFFVLSGAIGPSVRGIKQVGTFQTIEFDKYDGARTAPAYRLDLQWTFPIMGPDISIFLLLANITAHSSPTAKGYTIKDGVVKDNDMLDAFGFIPFVGFKLTAPFRKENP